MALKQSMNMDRKREDQARSIEVVFPAALPLFAEPQFRLRLFEGVCMQLGVPPEAQVCYSALFILHQSLGSSNVSHAERQVENLF